MTQQRRLGKGLGALLGESALEATRAEQLGGTLEVDVGRIVPNRYQPRQTFDDASIAELAESIGRKGVLQPLIVTPRAEGDYMLVSGERRLRAARQAGLSAVPVIVRDVGDRELLEIALIENLQREDLDAIEEAIGYERLMSEFGVTQAQVGEQVGRSRPAVTNALRLLELPDAVQSMIKEGALSAGHGRALLGVKDRRRIVPLARKAAKGGYSVRQVERIVKREGRAAGSKRAAGKRAAESDAAERTRLEEELQRQLGTRVKIHLEKEGKGRIEVAFYSLDDLHRLVERLGAKPA
jgi:ParB family chromosome partitioning protein